MGSCNAEIETVLLGDDLSKLIYGGEISIEIRGLKCVY